MESERVSRTSLLRYEPQGIDFGDISPGKGASATLNVHGGPGKVSVRSDQIKALPTTFECGNNVLEITLLAGVSGELIWDEIILETDTQDYKVPVTARWIEQTTETTLEPSTEAALALPKESVKSLREERTFKAKSCSLCGKNFGYSIDSGSWEQCTCTKYEMVKNMSSRIVRELRYGAKDLPSYLQELWNFILGREKL